MLAKLALAGIKNRRRDYLVLLAGLTMSAAIFYMFANLATNKAFGQCGGVTSCYYLWLWGRVINLD